MARDEEVQGAAAEPGRTSHRSLGLPCAVIKREARGEGRSRKKRERRKKKRFPDADQAVSRIEMNGRLISALVGLFAQPKPRPMFAPPTLHAALPELYQMAQFRCMAGLFLHR